MFKWGGLRAIVMGATLLMAISCEKEFDPSGDNNNGNTPTQQSEFVVSNLSVAIPAEGGETGVSFNSAAAWSAALINDRASDWLSFTPTSGAGGAVTLKVTAAENTGYDERSATLRVTSGGHTTDILVAQKHKDALISTNSKYELGAGGGDINVEIKSNVEFSFECDAKWLKEKPQTRGLETHSLVFEAEANTQAARREARITFTSGSLKEVVSVYQGGTAADSRILLSEKNHTVAAEGQTIIIEAVSGKNVEMLIPDGCTWITEGNKESTNKFYLVIAPNEGEVPRENFVSFTDKESGFSENVNILQLSSGAIALVGNYYSFGLEGGVLDIEIIANGDVSASSSEPWCTLKSTRAMTGKTLSFAIAAAPAGTDRTATVTLSCGKAKQEIKIRQYALDAPISFACPAVKDRLVALFDLNGDGELSFKEAEAVTSMENVFVYVYKEIRISLNTNSEGNVTTYTNTSYQEAGCSINPDEFTSFDEFKYFTGIKEITPYAFSTRQLRSLNKVTLPPTVKVIGHHAFYGSLIYSGQYENGMTGLCEINFPEGLEEIGNYAFMACPLTKGITLPSTLKRIGNVAFSRCYILDEAKYNENYETLDRDPYYYAFDGLKRIVVPESVEYLGENAFERCCALEYLEIPKTCVYSGSYRPFRYCYELKELKGSAVANDGHALVDKNGKMYAYFGTPVTEYVVPEGVKTITSGCFDYLNSELPKEDWNKDPETWRLRTLTLPSTIELQENSNIFTGSGFQYLSQFKGFGASADGRSLIIDGRLVAVARYGLESYTLPEGITAIGPYACYSVPMQSLTIPNTIKEIGRGAFESSSLQSVVLPQWMKTIPAGMFYRCTNLETVEGLDGVETIERNAFYNCVKLLKRFQLPSSVKSIGAQAFNSYVGGIIEIQSLVPPKICDPYYEIQDNRVIPLYDLFGNCSVYVPDIAYDRYRYDYYYSEGWRDLDLGRISELYEPPQIDIHNYGNTIIIDDTKGYYSYELVKVEPGSFTRRSPSNMNQQLTVNITKPFYIGRTEFPQWLWKAVMHFCPSYYSIEQQRAGFNPQYCPLENVSWDDAVAFLEEMNKLPQLSNSGIKLRLPTEAEWEFAARGGKYSQGYHFSGSNNYEDVAVAGYAFNYPTYCGSKASNELGLYDMHGNVEEFCQDDFVRWDDASLIPGGDNPLYIDIDQDSRNKVIRGGCFRDNFRSYYIDNEYVRDGFIGEYPARDGIIRTNTSVITGFRPAVSCE